MASSYLLVSKSQTFPSPIIPKAKWDKGAKSPEAPTVPLTGTKGKISLLNPSIYLYKLTSEIPEYPLANTLILKAKSILVFPKSKGVPTPAAWDLIRFFYNSIVYSLEIIVLAKFPNPVFTP